MYLSASIRANRNCKVVRSMNNLLHFLGKKQMLKSFKLSSRGSCNMFSQNSTNFNSEVTFACSLHLIFQPLCTQMNPRLYLPYSPTCLCHSSMLLHTQPDFNTSQDYICLCTAGISPLLAHRLGCPMGVNSHCSRWHLCPGCQVSMLHNHSQLVRWVIVRSGCPEVLMVVFMEKQQNESR